MPTVGPGRGPIRAADVSSGRTGSTGGARLLDDWKKATFDEGITSLARGQLKPEYQKAFDQATGQAGRPLTDDETSAVIDGVDRRLLAGAVAQVRASVGTDPRAQDRIVAQSVATLRQQAPQLRNPFTPVAEGDVRARARETILFENAQLVVLVDKFCPSPKVLVVPKQRALTPLDVSPGVLGEMSRVSAIASDTFKAVANSRPADVWINPPEAVTIGQVHVHVQPRLPDFAQKLTPAEAADPLLGKRRLATLQADFWKKFGAEFQARLRP